MDPTSHRAPAGLSDRIGRLAAIPAALAVCLAAAPADASPRKPFRETQPAVATSPALRGPFDPAPPLRGTADDDVLTGSVDPGAAVAVRNAGVFNTVPIPIGHLAVSDRWQAILDDDPARVFREGCDVAPATCRSAPVRAFARLEREMAGAAVPRIVLLRKVNLAVNTSVRYQTDPVTYGVEDYWATPAETALHGAGDCEDFAIMKMGMLEALGLPLSTMQLVVVKDLKRHIGHAILAVKLGGGSYILDNLSDAVRTDDQIAEYQPYYSVSSVGSWLHGIRRAAAPAAVAPPGGGQVAAGAELKGTLPGQPGLR